jgi:hypothetical protein
MLAIRSLVASVALATTIGCGDPPPETGEVVGIVTLNGEPLPKVSVLFTPESAGSSTALSSGAITDQDGRYKLVCSVPNNRVLGSPRVIDGALVGRHVAIVEDFKMMDEMLPPPGRVPIEYADAATTPLHFEVKPGQQTIDIKLVD